ncbi:MAG: RagB/SusD family nutrient uptake outer membrane protein [Sphingobacteriales bacterium]|nr:MAG: RagB/SusD family nutrient uptake outer membrane protein [Sphingobacteriales bacterium]
MKKFYIPFILCTLMISVLVSCKKGGFLEQTVTTNLSEETIFADSAYTEGFLANIYADIGFSASASRFGNGGLDAASDEAEVANINPSTALAFASGTVNAAIATEGPYDVCYKNLRAINKFLKYLPTTPIQTFYKRHRKAEAHFLRAWYYAMLIKHYGGVPIIGDTIYNYTDAIPVKRNTYEECVNYILAQCDSAIAIKDLPDTQTDISYGRVSRGACLALKSRVLLYAASPLFNGENPYGSDPLVGYPTAVAGRWITAARAANRVIGLKKYNLFTDGGSVPGGGFLTVFTRRVNTEYILQLMRPQDNTDLETLFSPPSRSGNGKGAFPYQQLVDAFTMRNGLPITDPASGYKPDSPYVRRDPRLRFTVLYDQGIVGNRTSDGGIQGSSPVNIFTGKYKGFETGQDAVKLGTPTGYYTAKMLDTNATGSGFWNTTGRCIPLIRYAEILLNYAEALNEIGGPEVFVPAETVPGYSPGDPPIIVPAGPTPLKVIQDIRKRAGIQAGTNSRYGIPLFVTKEQMREIIRHERRVELAFEEHRFWDVRRWLIAEQTDNQSMNGMEVRRNNAEVSYNVFLVRKHSFNRAMYLWPLPEVEVVKSRDLKQNPGY